MISKDQVRSKLSHHCCSDLPDLTNGFLNNGNKNKIHKSLLCFLYDIFSFVNGQLGKSSLVQHAIDTGDPLPIK